MNCGEGSREPPRCPSWKHTSAAPAGSVAAHDLARGEGLLDEVELLPDEQDVVDLERLGLAAGGPHDQVAGAETQKPVAEQVAAPLRDDHAHRVVDHLAAADLL